MVLINADFMLGNRDVQWAQALHVVAQGRDLVSKFLTSAHIAQLGEDELKDTLSHDLKLVDEWDGQSHQAIRIGTEDFREVSRDKECIGGLRNIEKAVRLCPIPTPKAS